CMLPPTYCILPVAFYNALVRVGSVLFTWWRNILGFQSYEGYSESVSCPYESQYQNSLKYICRGNQPSTCLQQALITSDTKSNGRFTLDDDKVSGTFTVNINSLVKSDSGSYLCGVQRNSDLDVFSAVEQPTVQFSAKHFLGKLNSL
uniref:Immunoglobulin V-set domain-containing protein n=1 Tax=Pundamilia nyererei TaxID=303518 RepID=A0A3B4F7Y2_9CICH